MSGRTPGPGLAAGLALSAALLTACTGEPKDPLAGTVTTTTNTISGRVLPDKGSPVAARVTAYSSEYQPEVESPSGQAAPPRLRFEAMSDSLGFFSVTVKNGYSYVLVAASEGETPLVEWSAEVHALPERDSTSVDTLVIRPAAALKGFVRSAGEDTTRRLWAGFLGTGVFAPVDNHGAFALENLPTGWHELSILRDTRTGPGWTREAFLVAGITLQEGKSHILDTVELPATPPGPTPLQAVACLETPTTLVKVTGPSATGKSADRMRTVTSAPTRELVELDLCLGTWRTVMRLPSQPRTLFSDSTRDWAFFQASKEVYRIDPAAGTAQIFAEGYQGLNMGYRSGRFYALNGDDSSLTVFAGEAAFLSNTPERTWKLQLPLGPDAVFDFEVAEQGLSIVIRSDKLEVYFLDLRDPYAPQTSAPRILEGFTGNFRGLASGRNGSLWILNDANELYEYRADRTLWSSVIRIDAPVPMSGLTRFQ